MGIEIPRGGGGHRRLQIPDRPFVRLEELLPALEHQPPYLVAAEHRDGVSDTLRDAGFVVLEAVVPTGSEDVEADLAETVGRCLQAPDPKAANWGAFRDWAYWYLAGDASTPTAVLIIGLDDVLRRNIQQFVGAVHRLLSTTDDAKASDVKANRQLEYFFVGDWNGLGS